MRLDEAAYLLGGEIHGDPSIEVGGPVGLDAKEIGGIAFAENESYLRAAEISQAACLVLPEGLTTSEKPFITVSNPRSAFLKLLQSVERPLPLADGVHPTAVIDPTAILEEEVRVGPYAVIEAGVRVSRGARIYAFSYIGEGCSLGQGCSVYPHAVLYANVHLGARSIVHAGTVLGADGFGYAEEQGQRVKVPQIGSVEIGEDCEIGALTAVDRATLGSTRIGAGTKIDNLVQVAHNVEIGRNCAIAAQAGIAGSATLGDQVLVAGQAGVGDHVSVASNVVLEARSAALQELKEPGHYIGTPARRGNEAKRALLLVARLPELFSRLRKIERRLEEK